MNILAEMTIHPDVHLRQGHSPNPVMVKIKKIMNYRGHEEDDKNNEFIMLLE